MAEKDKKRQLMLIITNFFHISAFIVTLPHKHFNTNINYRIQWCVIGRARNRFFKCFNLRSILSLIEAFFPLMIQSWVRWIRIFNRLVIHDTYLDRQCSRSYSRLALMNEVITQSCNSRCGDMQHRRIGIYTIDKPCRRSRITRHSCTKACL